MATTASSTPSINITYTLANAQGFATTTETSNVGTTLSYSDGTGTGNINIGVVTTGYISSGETVYIDFQKFPKLIWDSQIELDFASDVEADYVSASKPSNGVKGMVVINTWDSSILNVGSGHLDSWSGIVTGVSGEPSSFVTGLPNNLLPTLQLNATGNDGALSGGFTDILTSDVDQTGSVAINTNSTWSFSNTIGKTPIYSAWSSQYRHVITLTTDNFTNISGSGGLSSGASGDAVFYPIWNDFGDHVNEKGEPAVNPWSGNLPRLSYEILVVGVTG